MPLQPTGILKSGDMYLKSIDKAHRRFYEKIVKNDNAEKDNVQQLYVSYEYIFYFIHLFSDM
jgi:poly-beta-hydroxyalkanoate depolymerase